MRNFKWTKRNILCLMLLVLAIIFVVSAALVIHFATKQDVTQDVSVVTQSMRQMDPIPHDDTKLDLPSWTIQAMTIVMWVIIGIIGFGILCLTVYIIGHFWKRRHGTLLARVSEQKEENDENPNLVRITLGEEVKDEKSN